MSSTSFTNQIITIHIISITSRISLISINNTLHKFFHLRNSITTSNSTNYHSLTSINTLLTIRKSNLINNIRSKHNTIISNSRKSLNMLHRSSSNTLTISRRSSLYLIFIINITLILSLQRKASSLPKTIFSITTLQILFSNNTLNNISNSNIRR